MSLHSLNLLPSNLRKFHPIPLFFLFFFFNSRYACLLDWGATTFSVSAGVIDCLSSLIWCPPQMAVFFAYIPPGKRSGSEDTLHLICCPSHVGGQVKKELREMNINFPIDAHSEKKMVPQYDKAYVCLSGGIRALDEDDMENVHLRWLHLCIMYIIENSAVQTGNVWRSNTMSYFMLTTHFRVCKICLMVFNEFERRQTFHQTL